MNTFDKDLDNLQIVNRSAYIADVISDAIWCVVLDEYDNNRGIASGMGKACNEGLLKEILEKWSTRETLELTWAMLKQADIGLAYSFKDDGKINDISVFYKNYSFKLSW